MRLDRLWSAFHAGGWRVSVGRQAQSFGNGLVFQPMDLFNPFSPTEIDRDFKQGEDMITASRPFDDGSEVSLIGAARRGNGSSLSRSASSLALRYSGYHDVLALEGLVGVHLGDPLLAFGASGPLGTALWRSDLVAQRIDGQWRLSGVINLDWSFVLGERNFYVFTEFYRNGLGLDGADLGELTTRVALRRRIERGELFTLGRHHLAIGATVEWHPLLQQQFLMLHELQSHSQLLQTTLVWDPDDNQRLQLSLIAPLGSRGEEFGAIELGPIAPGATTGGGERVLLRWSRYF